MDIYVARQPIFNRNFQIYGYELLYRRSMNNFYEGKDDNQATAELISNAFFTLQISELTGDTKAFINLSAEMIEMEIPFLLPKQIVVIEILERIVITETLISACKKLKKNGYLIALDDFVFDESYLPLIELADIIKIEFPVISYENQNQLIKKYKGKIKFLAEKIETREEYQLARDMGYDYYQGYFFSKPVIISGKELPALNINLIRIITELKQDNVEYQKIVEIVETDLGLSYKLLRLANSIFFGSKNRIKSIKQALVRLGVEEVKKWIYLMMLKEIQTVENKELIKNCLIRAKLMEQISYEIGKKNQHLKFFMTGLFSSIDILLNRSMKEILDELPIDNTVKDALLGVDNNIREILDIVLNFEKFNWNEIQNEEKFINISHQRFMGAYLEALKWVVKLDI